MIEEVNRKCHSRNTTVQLSTLYTTLSIATLSATSHTYNIINNMKPIADHTVSQYDRLKMRVLLFLGKLLGDTCTCSVTMKWF